VLTIIFLAWLRSSPTKAQVEEIKQLSDDGEEKDEFAAIETDGLRVYFTEKYAGNFRLAQVAASGGQVAPVTTQIPAAYRASMAPDLSGLLVSENVIGHHPVWFQLLAQVIRAAWEPSKFRGPYSRQKASRSSIPMDPALHC
jgi:hypothetical protein